MKKEKRLYAYDNYNNRLLEYAVSKTKDAISPESIHAVKVKKEDLLYQVFLT